MRVPVLQVTVSQSLSILWQLDVGFYDELPWIQQQIVKVWKIVTANDEVCFFFKFECPTDWKL